MSRIIGLCILFPASTFVASSCFAQLDASTTCNLTAVPTDAIRVSQPSTPAMLHFPDPRTVPPDYSGCLNTWIEGGIRMIEAKFEGGKIKWYRMGNGEIYCEYENDHVTRQDVKDEVKKQMEATFPKPQYDFQFCPPGAELVPSKWK